MSLGSKGSLLKGLRGQVCSRTACVMKRRAPSLLKTTGVSSKLRVICPSLGAMASLVIGHSCIFRFTRLAPSSKTLLFIIKMSGFPFPDDRLALSRLDYCTTRHCDDVLSCTLRARQCGSYLQNSADEKTIERAIPVLQNILAPPVITEWQGACPMVAADGVCNLLTSNKNAAELWKAFGKERLDNFYAVLENRPPPHKIPDKVEISTS